MLLGYFHKLFQGKNNSISALRYVFSLLENESRRGESLRTPHDKCVPQQVIGETTDDFSTCQKESAQLHGSLPLGKHGAQSPQSGLEE